MDTLTQIRQELATERQNALNELSGNVSAPTETTEETVETPTEETEQTQEESETSDTLATEEETQQEQAPAEEPKNKIKNLYKALGKKDKRIAELEEIIAQKSQGFDSDAIELIDAIAQKQALESHLYREEESEKDAFIKSLPKDVKEKLDEEMQENPYAWRTLKKFYTPPVQAKKPKSNIGLVGNAGPSPTIEKSPNEMSIEELRALAYENVMKTGRVL